MHGSSRRASTRNTKLRMDEARGGIKVMAGPKNHKNDSSAGLRRLRRNQSDSVAFERKKRSNCAASDKEENGLIGTSPVKLRKTQSDLSRSPKTSVGNSLDTGGEEKVLPIGDDTEDAVVMAEEEMEEVEVETQTEEEGMKSFVDKEMDQPDEKPKTVQEEEEAEEEAEEEIPALVQEEEKKHNLVSMSPMYIAEKKQNLVMDYRAMKPDPTVIPHLDAGEELFQSTCIKHNRIQSIENLVMWRDVSRSAFVFGIGTFFLFSSSYAKDINFSLISASSYVGLVYLGFVFLCKSFMRRGETMQHDDGDERCVVGEEDAIWLLKMLLPYLNELLLKFRGLFSGDPETTLKLAALLFVMARCGSTITVWSLAKLTFFGVFTIPKVCSSYSTQLAKLGWLAVHDVGKFWLDRLRDGWESCTHKKAAAAATFALIWNISSAVARIWAFFMLVVAVKLYQQCAAEHSWNGREEEEEEEEGQEDSMAGQSQELGLHRHRGGPTRNEVDAKVDLGEEAGKRSK
ncbi:Reticulon [Musa troglodytarum]|uniref:Reticulon-like protein n=1 Tax=Musa troglodytarum TaxID=320322 RepID=A0A9E7HPY8_9LILI|nr:Reticulon [Musa troglodytarum]